MFGISVTHRINGRETTDNNLKYKEQRNSKKKLSDIINGKFLSLDKCHLKVAKTIEELLTKEVQQREA